MNDNVNDFENSLMVESIDPNHNTISSIINSSDIVHDGDEEMSADYGYSMMLTDNPDSSEDDQEEVIEQDKFNNNIDGDNSIEENSSDINEDTLTHLALSRMDQEYLRCINAPPIPSITPLSSTNDIQNQNEQSNETEDNDNENTETFPSSSSHVQTSTSSVTPSLPPLSTEKADKIKTLMKNISMSKPVPEWVSQLNWKEVETNIKSSNFLKSCPTPTSLSLEQGKERKSGVEK
mmetsp:Transcript_16555/g.16657  ORF Transcript_16555/g.16657 Transcript_16555/m.16657 type:complete len:235 (-) Transcript_16555:22-726(-)